LFFSWVRLYRTAAGGTRANMVLTLTLVYRANPWAGRIIA
jgi:hypothetical protein